MPQFSTFTINDGSATPVAITYSLANMVNGDIKLMDRRLTVPSFHPAILSSFSAPSKARPKSTKIARDFSLPHIRALNSVDTVVGTSRAVVTYYIDVNATAQEIKHLEAMVQNTGTQAKMVLQLRDLEPFFG